MRMSRLMRESGWGLATFARYSRTLKASSIVCRLGTIPQREKRATSVGQLSIGVNAIPVNGTNLLQVLFRSPESR
jgi:hypothetical protein